MMRSSVVSGCEAITRGAWESGTKVVVSYPGSPVTGVVDAAASYPELLVRWAANEKVALEVAAGVAYAGSSVLVVMKHVGVNVAADPLFNLAYTGVRGSLVVIVGDDPGASCSQNEQDTRLMGVAANIPVLEPSDVNESLLYTKLAFFISKHFDLPVIVRMTTQLCYATQKIIIGERTEQNFTTSFAEPLQKYLLLPHHVPARHRALLKSLQQFEQSSWSRFFYQQHWPHTLAADAYSLSLSSQHQPAQASYPLGLICAGHTYAQVIEHLEGLLPILQVGCAFPLNQAAINEFASRCKQLIVTEESSNYLRDSVRALGHQVLALQQDSAVGAFDIRRLREAKAPELTRILDRILPPTRSIPIALVNPSNNTEKPILPTPVQRPPGFCAGCSHVGAFDVLRSLDRYVVGDIGCYTLGGTPSFGALHSNLCMGASIGVLQGYLMTSPDKRREVVAVIGDSTFFHSGIPSVITAVSNRQSGTLLILDNSGTAMTGFQKTGPNLDEQGWDNLLAGLGVEHRAVVPALDIAVIRRQIHLFDSTEGLAVIVLKGLCVQARPRKGSTNFRYTVTSAACTNCGICKTRTDCPALVPTTTPAGKAVFSITNACIGCGMCSQTCPERAILPLTVKTGVSPLDKVLGKVRWDRVIRFVQNNKRLHQFASRFERELD